MFDLETGTISKGITNKDKVVNYLKERQTDKVSISKIWKETQIKNREQVYQIMRNLEQNLKVKKEEDKHTGYYTWIGDGSNSTEVKEETNGSEIEGDLDEPGDSELEEDTDESEDSEIEDTDELESSVDEFEDSEIDEELEMDKLVDTQ